MFDWLFDPVKDSKPYWMELLPPTITVILFASGYWFAFRSWRRQKNIETRLQHAQQREAARVAACKSVWSLLAYISEKENTKTVLVKRGTKDQPVWSIRSVQAKEYMQQLEEVWFGQGHGLFISKGVRDDLYQFRGILYRLLEKEMHKGNNLDMLRVENEEVPKSIRELRERLRENLKNEVYTAPDFTDTISENPEN